MSEKTVLRNVVGGERVDAADGRSLDLVDPTTGEVAAQAIFGGLVALPDREVFVMVGDGSYMMMNSELQTSVMLGKKIVVAGAIAIGLLPQGAAAQETRLDPRWTAWTGCWRCSGATRPGASWPASRRTCRSSG